jgi:hypothetical protein
MNNQIFSILNNSDTIEPFRRTRQTERQEKDRGENTGACLGAAYPHVVLQRRKTKKATGTKKTQKAQKMYVKIVNLVFIFGSSSSTTNPVCVRRVNLSVCSLPLNRHIYRF